MRNTRAVRLIALLSILLALAGCAAAANTAKLATDVQALLDTRSAGVNSANQQEYLSSVSPSNTVLVKEETNLIRAAGSLGIKDYKATASDVTTTGEGGCTAKLTQSYTLGGALHKCTYTALFTNEGGKLYYSGPDFLLKQNSQVKVYYMSGRDSLAQQLLNEETAVLASMKEELGFTPKGAISVKLFDDQKVFLQSVKLDLPDWVGGWHEFGESIKSFTGAYGVDGSDYKSMLNHESTHRMVSELSNDNAAYWIQEGLASVYQVALDVQAQKLLTPEELAESYTPFGQQKQIDLEKLDMNDQGAVTKYYATSKAFAAFLVDKYGWDKVKQALEYMKKYELIPVTGAEKMDKTNARTDEALKAVFGFQNDSDFQNAFDAWQRGG